MTPGFAKPRAELPWLPYGECNRVIINAHNFASPLLTGLISYWKLDEASGNAVDSHGTNTLTDENTVASAAGKINTCRDFELDNSERFFLASNSSLQTGDIDFTWSVWFRPETLVLAFLFSKGGLVVGTREYGAYISTDGIPRFFVSDASSNSTVLPAATSVTTGTWNHLVCWHDAGSNQIGLSLNGATAVTAAHTTGVRSGTFEFELGARKNQPAFFDGMLDEVGFWKRLLTTTERASLHNGGSGKAYPFT